MPEGNEACRVRVGAAVILLASAIGAHAAPPFETDDAEPTELGHFETYLFSAGIREDDGFSGTALGVEVNYGLLPDLEIGVALPLDYDAGRARDTRFGVGGAGLSAQYRFIEEDEHGWRPQVSVNPEIEIALGEDGHKMNGSSLRTYLPVWVQKCFGDWTVFGGGGYWINPGAGHRDFWFSGIAVLRQITPAFQMGAEIFHQGAEERDEPDTTGFNIGALYELSEAWSVVASAGRGLTHAQASNQFSYFIGIGWTT